MSYGVVSFWAGSHSRMFFHNMNKPLNHIDEILELRGMMTYVKRLLSSRKGKKKNCSETHAYVCLSGGVTVSVAICKSDSYGKAVAG